MDDPDTTLTVDRRGLPATHGSLPTPRTDEFAASREWSDFDGWDEFARQLERELAALPANWFEDSSLETWFPITAEEMTGLRAELRECRRSKNTAVNKWVARLKTAEDALRRIEAGEVEVPGLRPEFYGHAAAIARKALAAENTPAQTTPAAGNSTSH